MKLVKLISTVAIAVVVLAIPLVAQVDSAPATKEFVNSQGLTVRVGASIRHDTSPPLSEMIKNQPVPEAFGAEKEVPIHIPESLYDIPNTNTGPDPLTTGFVEGSTTPAPSVAIEAIDSDDNSALLGSRIMPPDTNGDVGVDYIISYVNLVWMIQEKDNPANVMGPFVGNSFWTGFGGICETANAGDPIVLYDQIAGRWVFSQFTGSGSDVQCFAISTTGNPMGPYHRYAIPVGNTFNDYEKISMWTNANGDYSGYYMTSNHFSGGFIGMQFTAFERDKMLTGAAATIQTVFFPNNGSSPQRFSSIPSNLQGDPPAAGVCPYFIDTLDEESFGTTTGHAGFDGYQFWQYCVDFATPGNTVLNGDSNSFVRTTEFDANLCSFSNCVPQPAPGGTVATLSQMTMYALNVRVKGQSLQAATAHSVDLGGDAAGVRWAQFDMPSLNNITLLDTGSTANDGTSRWMPAVAVDQAGNMGLVYSASTSSMFPSVYYAGRQPSTPAGGLEGEQGCIAGTGSQTGGGRWGDYASSMVDPVDQCTFWMMGEYVETTGSFQWDTGWCAFEYPDCEDFIASGGFEAGNTCEFSGQEPNGTCP